MPDGYCALRGLPDAQIRFLDDLRPACDLGLDQSGELFGRAEKRLDAGILRSFKLPAA
jgi:hypothetical protein